MRILFVNHNDDIRFFRLMEAIRNIGPSYTVAHANQLLPNEELEKFAPTVIFHNLPVLTSYPAETNAICINFNESDSERSFSFENEGADNYIKDFVDLLPRNRDDSAKYTGDVIYNGDPRVFQESLEYLVNSKNFDFRFFHKTPFNISGYAGNITRGELNSFYSNSRASIFLNGQKPEIMNAVINGATAILFDPDNQEKFKSDLEAVTAGKEYHNPDLPSKKDILANDTSVDRMIWIFKKIGLSKVSSDLKSLKSKLLKEYK
jgi:hypothetical protein